MKNRWKPSVTLAGIIEQDGRFLLVEEHTSEGLRLNNPAGHLEPDETLVAACQREVLEETAYHFSPQALVGVYLSTWQAPSGQAQDDITYLRFAFKGALGLLVPNRALDEGIVRTLWLTPAEIVASQHLHRSPLVVQCMQDYLAGKTFSLDVLQAF